MLVCPHEARVESLRIISPASELRKVLELLCARRAGCLLTAL